MKKRNQWLALTILCALFALPACEGGEEDGGPGEPDGELLTSLSVPSSSSAWTDKVFLNPGSGAIEEVVFDSDQPIYIDAIQTASTTYYEFVGSSTTSEGPYIRHFTGVWDLTNYSPGVMIPPIHTAVGDFPATEYRFKITNTGGSSASVALYRDRKEDGNFNQGGINLNFFVYSYDGSNEVIKGQADADEIKRYMNEIFGQVGIWIDTIKLKYREDSDALNKVLYSKGIDDFLNEASRATAGSGGRSINCFLFPQLAGGTLGMDGSIPGPGGLQGFPTSGLLALSADLGYAVGGLSVDQTNKKIIAKILAHEIGHFLGLYHTTESNGTAAGAVTDTPVCGPGNDGDGDGLVGGAECDGKGGDYLMFWAFDDYYVSQGNFQTKMSRGQGVAANTHPAVN